ncbi:mediator complex subunit 27 [Arctopsyche grandis]|uniref:mediator complex subunit 27 n=1 Tax=Arctopsyche grandis TaxID=121162 RepID=UPI00406D96AF
MEQALAALCAVRALRSGVGQVFECVGGGGGGGGSAELIAELQEQVLVVGASLREVEACSNALQPPPGPFSLGNAALLSQEISVERQALYVQLVNSYRWTDKVHEYSGVAQSLLSQNSLKRSYVTSSSAKRRRTHTSSHNVSPQNVDNVINAIDRTFNDMKITVSRPFATNAVVQISLGHVLKAVIAFKGLMIEWVVVKGHGEVLDLWTESRHRVFRKVTENAQAAMLHFFSPTLPELAVRSFMAWFHSYINLFSEACKRCGNHLHDTLPPTWHDFRTLEPFHEECKQ